ncbi:MAG TPA: hypothetical protein VLZ30_07445 [Verrucomicrobiae bacterium]|nr:hypothetical protein [Verrucomicrobiae bacterium]
MSVLGAMVKFTLPFPEPATGQPTVIQGTDAVVVQAHDEGALTESAPLPPPALKGWVLLTEPGQTDAGAYDTLTFSPVAETEFTLRLKLP